MATDGDAKKFRVLLVNANANIVKLMCTLLIQNGHEVQFAVTAESALRQVSVVRPEVIFTGLELPDSNGYDLVQQFRGRAESRHAFIVALEGSSPLHRYDDYKSAGFDHILVKPVKLDEVVRTVAFLSEHCQLLARPVFRRNHIVAHDL